MLTLFHFGLPALADQSGIKFSLWGYFWSIIWRILTELNNQVFCIYWRNVLGKIDHQSKVKWKKKYVRIPLWITIWSNRSPTSRHTFITITVLRAYLWIWSSLFSWLNGFMGGATTFACKSQGCLWQDWYILMRFVEDIAIKMGFSQITLIWVLP